MKEVREDWPVGRSASLSLQEGWARPTTKPRGGLARALLLGILVFQGDPRSPMGVRKSEANRNSPREGTLGTE